MVAQSKAFLIVWDPSSHGLWVKKATSDDLFQISLLLFLTFFFTDYFSSSHPTPSHPSRFAFKGSFLLFLFSFNFFLLVVAGDFSKFSSRFVSSPFGAQTFSTFFLARLFRLIWLCLLFIPFLLPSPPFHPSYSFQ